MSTFTVQHSDLSSLRSKTVLITGGSQGIGLSTAQLVASLSPTNNIIILDQKPPRSSFVSSVGSSRLLFQSCDVTSWKSLRSGFAAGYSKFGRIDAVFVNAGISEYKDQFFGQVLDGEGLLEEPNRKTLDIDMTGASDTTKLAIYYLRKNKEGGSIVMTASLAGYLASAGLPLYSTAKHGVVGLMRALKNETAKLSIAISVVAPGITVTPILTQGSKSSATPSEWAAEMQKAGVAINAPESVALAVGSLMNEGMKGNGKGLLIQSDRMWDIEAGLAKSRSIWMGQEMLDLFRGGRNAPLYATIEASKI